MNINEIEFKNKLNKLNKKKLIILINKIGISNNNLVSCKKEELVKIIMDKTIKKTKIKKNVSTSHKLTKKGGYNNNLVRIHQPLNFNILKELPYKINYDTLNLNIKDYYPKSENIFILGDIHGDLLAMIESLKIAGLISIDVNPLKVDNNKLVNNINWIGGNSILVQMGDQIDRTRPANWDDNNVSIDNAYHDEGSDLKIMELFDKLGFQAQKTGGCVISLLGNHELMNVGGDFRYVSSREFQEFGNKFKSDSLSNLSNDSSSNSSSNSVNSKYPFGYLERKNVFKPGGIIAKRMGTNRKAVIQIGKWIFVHGGFVPQSALKYNISEINNIVSNYLNGSSDSDIKKKYNELFYSNNMEHSPFWSRTFGNPDNSSKTTFVKTINNLNLKNNNFQYEKAKGMIIGHTPQFFNDKGINSSFNNHLWRTDVGMSRAFGPRNNKGNNIYRNIQLLCIKNNDIISIIK